MILFLSFLLFPNIFEQLSQRRLLESGRSLERGVEYKLNVVHLRGGVFGKKLCPRSRGRQLHHLRYLRWNPTSHGKRSRGRGVGVWGTGLNYDHVVTPIFSLSN